MNPYTSPTTDYHERENLESIPFRVRMEEWIEILAKLTLTIIVAVFVTLVVLAPIFVVCEIQMALTEKRIALARSQWCFALAMTILNLCFLVDLALHHLKLRRKTRR